MHTLLPIHNPPGGKANPKRPVKPKCEPTTPFHPPILDEADGPAGRLTQVILASREDGVCPTVGSPEYRWWMKEIAWAQRNLHSILPLSIIDVALVSSYQSIHFLSDREEKLATLFEEYLPHDVTAKTPLGKDGMEGTGIHSEKEPPSFPIPSALVYDIRVSYKKHDSKRILLPSGSPRGGDTMRIVKAHENGKCQEPGAFEKLEPHAKGMTIALMLVLRRINAMILKEKNVLDRSDKLIESESEPIRDHALKYVQCLRQAIASHISGGTPRESRGWFLLDAALLALEEGTVMETEMDEKLRAKVFGRLSFITPEESKMAIGQDDTYAEAITKGFENDGDWAEWKRLVKAAFAVLDQKKLEADLAQTVVSVVSKSSYAVDPLMKEMKYHLQELGGLIRTYPPPKTRSRGISMADHQAEAVKLMSFLGFRLMQKYPEKEIPMERYLKNLGLMKMTKEWKENVDFLASATETAAEKEELFKRFLEEVGEFASNKKVTDTIQGHVRNVHSYRLGKQVDGGAARARRSLEAWRRWLIGTILGHVAYNEYCKVQGRRSRLSNRLMSKVDWALKTMAGPVDLTAIMAVAMSKVTFLIEDYTRSVSVVEPEHRREDEGFAEMAAELIRQTAWKKEQPKKAKRFDRFVMLLIRLLNDVVESIRKDL